MLKRSNEMPCDCGAYGFPHRPGGGACYVGKHCTFGESVRDILVALMAEFGVRSSSDCRHVLEVDERCVGCHYLRARPLDVGRVAESLSLGLTRANESIGEISPGTKLVVGVK
jgi:hypothetical protein